MTEGGVDLQVVEATARYKAPARFDDELDVTLGIDRLGTTSMTMATLIGRDGELLVEGRMVHVFVDTATMAKRPIPDWLRTGLEAYASSS